MKSHRSTAFPMALFVLVAPAAHAASDCQPVFDAYAAQAKVPALQKTVTTPGMADPVQMILTQDRMFSRVGPNDVWTKTVIDDAMRQVMAKGMPAPGTIGECRLIGPETADGRSGTAYEFAPSVATGNAAGERITVLIESETGLPISETALKAGTVAKIVYDGVAVPAP